MRIKAELTANDNEVTIKILPRTDKKAVQIVKMIKNKGIKILV